LLILIPQCLGSFFVIQFGNRVWLFIYEKIVEVFLLDTAFLPHINALGAPFLAITAITNPLAVWLSFLIVTQLCLSIAGVHYTTVTVRSTLADLALCHTEDPIILVLIAMGWVSHSVMRFVKASELYYASVAGEAWRYIVVEKELAFVRVEHFLIPVSQLHLRQVVQALKHFLMLWVLNTVDHNPNVKEIGLVRLLKHVVQTVVAPMLFEVRTEINDLLSKRILIVCNAAAVTRIHDHEKIIEVIVLLALVFVEIEFIIDKLEELEDLLLYWHVHEVDIVLLLFCLPAAHLGIRN